jgi:hypothetical protein
MMPIKKMETFCSSHVFTGRPEVLCNRSAGDAPKPEAQLKALSVYPKEMTAGSGKLREDIRHKQRAEGWKNHHPLPPIGTVGSTQTKASGRFHIRVHSGSHSSRWTRSSLYSKSTA